MLSPSEPVIRLVLPPTIPPPINIDDLIQLRANAISVYGLASSVISTVVIEPVIAPSAPLPPILDVNAPLLIGPCDPISFDLTVQRKAGRNLNALTIAVTDFNGTVDAALTAAVQAQVTDLSGNFKTYTIPQTGTNSSWTVRVEATNYLGASSVRMFTMQRSTEATLPMVSIANLPSSAIPANVPVSLFAQLRVPDACIVNNVNVANATTSFSNYFYKWTIEGPLAAPIRQTNTSGLFLDPLTLYPQEIYGVVLSVTSKNADGTPGRDTWDFRASIRTLADTFTVTLGGSRVVGSKGVAITPRITNSFYRVLNMNEYICSWSCLTAAGSVCLTKSGAVVSLPSSCSDSFNTSALSTGAVVLFVTVLNSWTLNTAVSEAAYISIVSST